MVNPGKYIPGNKMSFAGMSGDLERAHLIAYLESLSWSNGIHHLINNRSSYGSHLYLKYWFHPLTQFFSIEDELKSLFNIVLIDLISKDCLFVKFFPKSESETINQVRLSDLLESREKKPSKIFILSRHQLISWKEVNQSEARETFRMKIQEITDSGWLSYQ